MFTDALLEGSRTKLYDNPTTHPDVLNFSQVFSVQQQMLNVKNVDGKQQTLDVSVYIFFRFNLILLTFDHICMALSHLGKH